MTKNLIQAVAAIDFNVGHILVKYHVRKLFIATFRIAFDY